MTNTTHTVVIGAGSNIDPHAHVRMARKKIGESLELLSESDWIETEPIGYADQDAFLNGVFLVRTKKQKAELAEWLRGVEAGLGRVRTENKFGPRTIDLDIVVWDGEVVDADFYTRGFLKRAVLQVLPDLKY